MVASRSAASSHHCLCSPVPCRTRGVGQSGRKHRHQQERNIGSRSAQGKSNDTMLETLRLISLRAERFGDFFFLLLLSRLHLRRFKCGASSIMHTTLQPSLFCHLSICSLRVLTLLLPPRFFFFLAIQAYTNSNELH